MTATIPITRTHAYLAGAILSTFASLYVIILISVIADDQMVIDPTTHRVSFEPWWAMFGNSDRVPVLVLLLVSLGFAWLAWYLCRRAFSLRPQA